MPMQLGSINATGTAVVCFGSQKFVAVDTPRAIGIAALERGAKVGDILICHTHYPGWGHEVVRRRLAMDDGKGFAPVVSE